VPVFGYSGQIKPHKGVDVLIDAAAMLAARGHRFKLAVYGNPDEDRAYTHALQQRAGQAGWLEWRGKYAAGGVWDVLAGLDALVIPSRWYENSPNVILEAQAAGVPVVATRLGGMAELIEHDVNGLLFELNDAGDLARQLARLVDEPGLIDRLRANAPAVKTSEQESVELARLYGELVSSPVVEAAI
jgi:glycosyltransferase involved in cell wall biosynthesis